MPRLLLLLLLPLAALAAEPPPDIAVGDWVFRAGTGRESAIIRALDHGEYSHIGIVTAVEPIVRITHATTDDDPTHPNQIIASDYAAYTAPAIAAKTAVARPAFLSTDERRAIAAQAAARLGEEVLTCPHPCANCGSTPTTAPPSSTMPSPPCVPISMHAGATSTCRSSAATTSFRKRSVNCRAYNG